MNFAVSTFQSLKSVYGFRRLVSLFLMLVLSVNPILAMPQGVIGLGNEISYNLAFHWYNSGWAAKFKAWWQNPVAQETKGWDGKGAPPGRKPSKPQEQETQEERNRQIVSVEVLPKTASLAPGSPLIMQAVQYIKSSAASTLTDAPNVSYAYKTSGDKTRVQNVYVDDGFGNQTMDYDSEGRLSQVITGITKNGNAFGSYTIDYQYDTLNRINLIRYPAKDNVDSVRKEVVPTYDVASRPKSLSYSGVSLVTNPIYNASSQTEQLSFGNSTSEEYTYDPQNGLLTNQKVKQGSTTHLNLGYEYLRSGTSTGKTGHLTKITDGVNAGRNREFTYDKIGRLTSVIGGANLWTMSYAYDQWGNRTSVTKTGGNGADGASIPLDGLASVSYNTATNRITNTNFSYDAAGNQTQAVDKNGDTIKYVYDTANRLIQVLKVVSGADVEIGAYQYGSSNQRLRAKENGVETYYAADGSGVIAEFQTLTSSSWQWKKNYVKWGDRLVATETADGLQYQHPDRLGTKLITNASGGVITEQTTLPFGTALPLTSTAGSGEGSQSASQPNPHQRRFTSYERSATTNLDYAVNRHYAAEQGRFTQVDPIGMAAVSLENPQTLNLYAYCANDPVNHTDPNGLLPKWLKKLLKIAMVILSIITAVLSVLAIVNTIVNVIRLTQFMQGFNTFVITHGSEAGRK